MNKEVLARKKDTFFDKEGKVVKVCESINKAKKHSRQIQTQGVAVQVIK